MNSKKYKVFALAAVLFTATMLHVATAADNDSQHREEAARLAAVLQSDSPTFDKAKACQRLAIIGDKSAVPALAALLGDEQLSNYARHGLEGIPDSAADAALRSALAELDGVLLIGAINSIGHRRDIDAVTPLTRLLAHDDDSVASAAARSLGKIASEAAAQILRDALARVGDERRDAVATACLICAQQRLQKNDRASAIKLYDSLRASRAPKHIVLAATQGAILARGNRGIPLLVEQLNSDDEARFRLALHTARLIDEDVSGQLAASFDTQAPQRQALLVLALGELGAESAAPLIVAAANDGAPEVRVLAIRVLAKLGDAAPVTALLEAAADPHERIANAARSTLARVHSDKVDTAIVAALGSQSEKTRGVAIDIAARRHIAAATPALLRLAESSDAAVRVAAVEALGATVELKDLPKLLAKASAGYSADETEAVRQAARAACVRMPQSECAVLLAGRMAGGNAAEKSFLLQQLGVVGGPQALKSLAAAAHDKDNAVQDAATRVLGEWLTADAAPVMFELAKSLESQKYKIRVLRGYVRIARQLDMPLAERLEVCRNTLEIAQRRDEKALVLDVLRRHRAPGGLEIAASLLDEAGLKEPACAAIVAIAERTATAAPDETAQALQRVIEQTNQKQLAERARTLIAQTRE